MVALQWLKKYLKDFTWKDFGYVAIIVVLFICSIRSCHSDPGPIPVVPPAYKPTEQKTDKKGTEYTQVTGTLYTPEQMKHMVDSIAKALGVKPGGVTGVTGTTTIIDTHAHTTKTVYVDTFTHTIADSISTKDYFLSYHGNYATRVGDFHMQLSPDTATYVSVVTKQLLRPDKYEVKIYHTNKLFEPQQGYSYTSTAPKTIAVIGPLLGMGYNGKILPVIGIGITFNLVGIKKKK